MIISPKNIRVEKTTHSKLRILSSLNDKKLYEMLDTVLDFYNEYYLLNRFNLKQMASYNEVDVDTYLINLLEKEELKINI